MLRGSILPTLLFALLLLLSGCDFGLLGKIRSQLRQPWQFFSITSQENGCTVQFLEPVIHRTSLHSLGFGNIDSRGGEVRIPYTLRVNGSSERPVEVIIHFAGDYLQSVTLPVVFHELLGRANIEAIMRLTGGETLSAWKMDPISPAKVRAVLAAEGVTYDPQAESVVVKLLPTSPEVRSLVLSIKHDAPAADYKVINLSFRK